MISKEFYALLVLKPTYTSHSLRELSLADFPEILLCPEPSVDMHYGWRARETSPYPNGSERQWQESVPIVSQWSLVPSKCLPVSALASNSLLDLMSSSQQFLNGKWSEIAEEGGQWPLMASHSLFIVCKWAKMASMYATFEWLFYFYFLFKITKPLMSPEDMDQGRLF